MVPNVGVTFPQVSGMGLMEFTVSLGNCLGASHKNSRFILSVSIVEIGSVTAFLCLSLLDTDTPLLITDDEWDDIFYGVYLFECLCEDN
jgi:hypothetical protein